MGSGTERHTQVEELLFDNGYLSKDIDAKESQFTEMDVLELIYNQFFFTGNSLGC